MVRFLAIVYAEKLEATTIVPEKADPLFEWILTNTLDKTPTEQELFIVEFIDGVKKLPEEAVKNKYGISIATIVTLLEGVLYQ